MASEGFPKEGGAHEQQQSGNGGEAAAAATDSGNNNSNRNSASLCGNGYGNDVSIPVYATVKGVRKKYVFKFISV